MLSSLAMRSSIGGCVLNSLTIPSKSIADGEIEADPPPPAFAGEGGERDYTAMRVTESLQLE
jgi:hypothetical protein